jgi:hypothetical protein
MLANRLENDRQARIWRNGKAPPKIWHQVLTVSYAVKSFRLPAIVADSPRKLAQRSKRETDRQSRTCENLEALPALFPIVPDRTRMRENQCTPHSHSIVAGGLLDTS